MTDEAKKKINRMYERFGVCGNREAICRDCSNLRSYTANRKWYKCTCYGESSSEATDWRVSWTACALYNQQYAGKPVIEVEKRARRNKAGEQVEGQMSLENLI